MREPFAKLIAGCYFLQPKVYLGFRFCEAPRPKPIDEDPLTIIFTGLSIDALYAKFSLSHIHFQSRIDDVKPYERIKNSEIKSTPS